MLCCVVSATLTLVDYGTSYWCVVIHLILVLEVPVMLYISLDASIQPPREGFPRVLIESRYWFHGHHSNLAIALVRVKTSSVQRVDYLVLYKN